MSAECPHSANLLAMLRLFAPLLERGWTLDLHLDKDGAGPVVLMGGDCNCPHRKEFDPADGHGFSYIHADNVVVPDDVPDDEYELAVARAMVEQAAELEGKPKN